MGMAFFETQAFSFDTHLKVGVCDRASLTVTSKFFVFSPVT